MRSLVTQVHGDIRRLEKCHLPVRPSFLVHGDIRRLEMFLADLMRIE